MSQIRVLRAKWIVPIDGPPLEGGWVEIDRGRVTRVGRGGRGTALSPAEDLGHCAILPGLVNAHTHLELGWLAGRIQPAGSFVDWIRDIVRARSSAKTASEAGITQAIVRGVEEARATGTVLVGDVSNSLATPPVLRAAGMDGVVFHELLGFNIEEPVRVVTEAWQRVDDLQTGGAAPVIQCSVVAHAPYSVSPALFRAIRDARRQAPLTVHLAESADELELLMTGRGALRALLDDFDVWNDQWQAPRCDPVEYLRRLDYLRPGCLVVHGVHLSPSALERLRDADAVLVTCPRSNEWVAAGMPPLAHFYASGVRVAVGTDSLASVGTLNLFDELAAMRRIAPEVSAASLLESATRIGAEALGRSTEFGTIAAGKRAALVAVRIPDGVRDVEECLVSGIGREAISTIGDWRQGDKV